MVQSFWSKPAIGKRRYRMDGGWLNKKYHYLSWAYSCLQLVKFYGEVELVTDEPGKRLLIDELKLPYTTVKTILENLDNYHPGLWALGKILAYQIQDTPFLHIDSDIFIWKPLPYYRVSAPVVMQSEEKYSHLFKDIADQIDQKFSFLPDKHKALIRSQNYVTNYNAGVIGGFDLDFFRHYTLEIFDFVDSSFSEFPKDDISIMNVIYEQFFIYALTRKRQMEVVFIFNRDSMSEIYKNQNFRRFRNEYAYLHVHDFKKNRVICELLERWMRSEHPSYYYRIIHLLKTKKI
ncbi:MAG: DUF6734 family protein [Balneolaceae bacterium]